MTVAQMQALRHQGYTAAQIAQMAQCGRGRVEKRTRAQGQILSPRLRETWAWLSEQYEPVRSDAAAAALGLSPYCAARRLRRLRERGLAVTVGRGLWVAMDLPC